MSSGVIIFLEISLVLGLALVFGIRELRNLRRYDRERAEKTRQQQLDAATSRDASSNSAKPTKP